MNPLMLLGLLGPAMQGVQGIASGQAGKKAGQDLQGDMDSMKGTLGDVLGRGNNALDYITSQGSQYNAIPGLRDDLMSKANVGGSKFANQMEGLAGSLGEGSAISDIMKSLQGGGANFNFGAGSSIMDQAMAGFKDFSTSSKAQSLEGAAQAMASGGQGLDAALASRGIAADSGVAADAMSGLGREQAGAMVNLERELNNIGNQVGLDATKFDINRVLQEQGMQSQFELGRAGLEAQSLLGAGSLELNRTGQAANMYEKAYTTPLMMEQGMFSENYMNPYMQHQGLMTGIGTDAIGQALAGFAGMMDMQNQQVQSAGAGKGAGMGGAMSGITDLFTNADWLSALTGS